MTELIEWGTRTTSGTTNALADEAMARWIASVSNETLVRRNVTEWEVVPNDE